MEPVYLDYNATTPMDQRVLDAMLPWFLLPANTGSRTHSYGQRAKTAVDAARAEIAVVIGAKPEEIIFTSGATESNNLAILGLADHGRKTRRMHIVSTTIEHKAVLEPLDQMRAMGFTVDLAPVTSEGYVDPDEIRKKIRPDTLLVSVMHANNETGVVQPIGEIGALTRETETLFHTDAAQTFGKELQSLREVRADIVSVSGHKIFGPQGIGAICVRQRGANRRPLNALMFGGGQERGLRPGTVPVALAVGFGEASRLAAKENAQRRESTQRLRAGLLAMLQTVRHQINGDPSRCQRHVINVRFPGVDAEALMLWLKDQVAISNGSACTVATYKPSHVLSAMGLTPGAIAESVRVAWGPTTAQDSFTPLICGVQALQIDR